MTTNVVSAVTAILAEKNPNAAARFTRVFKDNSTDNHQAIIAMNRFWRDELISLNTSTISARTCLVDDMEPEDWLRHFSRLVLPTIVSHDLPH